MQDVVVKTVCVVIVEVDQPFVVVYDIAVVAVQVQLPLTSLVIAAVATFHFVVADDDAGVVAVATGNPHYQELMSDYKVVVALTLVPVAEPVEH